MASLLEDYRRHAVAHGVHSFDGDYVACNAAHDAIQQIFLQLFKAGKAAELFSFYDDPDVWVQCWAAAHTLEVDEPRALAKLEQIERTGEPNVSSDAHYTIEEWKLGNLRFVEP